MHRHASSALAALAGAFIATGFLVGGAQAQNRDALIKAAKTEGKLMLYSSSGVEQSKTVLKAARARIRNQGRHGCG